MLSGARAFQLHDTYGFPIDLTLEMAAEQGLSVDEGEFRRLMAEQRQRAKADARAKQTGHHDTSGYRGVSDALGRAVEFTGYDEVVSSGRVAGLLVDGEPVHAVEAGAEVEVVLDRTPFYAEGGGQRADAGRIELAGAVIEVRDVQSPIGGVIVHRARVVSGEVRLGEPAQALVDVERRKAISRSHTATHMVHKAIREALGDSATQAGSENAPGRFRFDFHAAGASAPSVAAGRRGPGERAAGRGPRGARRGDVAGAGPSSGRDGAVRREVRRPGPGDLGRRLGPGAVRRHARRPLRPARSGHAARRGVDRVRRAPGRGAGRRGRLPVRRPRARAARPADRGAEGAPGGAARTGSARWSPSCGTRSARSSGSGPASCWRWPDSWPQTADGRVRRQRGHPRRRRRPVPTTCARSRWTCAGGWRRTARRWSRWPASPSSGRWSWWPRTTRPGAGGSPPGTWSGRPPACSAAEAAARTTWPRAAAPTPTRCPRRCAGWSTRRPAGHGGTLNARSPSRLVRV